MSYSRPDLMSPSMGLLTLTEIRRRTGVSMPALVKYKRQEAVPGGRLAAHAVGRGRSMRFTLSALPVFMSLAQEGRARRGRPRRKEDV